MSEDRQAAAAAGDVDEEVQPTAKSAEDRKAAAALAKLDTPRDEEAAPAREVDQEAVSKAMNRLAGGGGAKTGEVKKVKVDPADVALLVDQLELSKTRATDLLKQHDGDAVKAMRAYIAVPADWLKPTA